MNSRERVLKLFKGEPIDRVPCFSGMGNITETGIFRIGAGFYLDMNNNGVWDPGDKMLAWRLQPNDTPVTGDWNGDSITETGIFRNGDWYLDMNNNGHWDPEADMIFPIGQPGDKPVTGKW